ncbi:hypothetical protein D3C75_1291000 [compost metagenome]
MAKNNRSLGDRGAEALPEVEPAAATSAFSPVCMVRAPLLISRRIYQKLTAVVTAPITSTSGTLAATTSPTGIPAASAVSLGAP